MRNKSNKGFTLVELIIAMSIFTVVIGLGYGMLNKINISTKNQSDITSNQLNANLINKYVTKDLEQCKTFVGPENENVGFNYEFIINEDDEQIKYMVSITSKGNKEYYTLTRKSKDSEIDLAVNQPKISKTPFFIKEKEDKDNLFSVQVDNVKETSGQYVFEVSSRLVASSGVTEIPKEPNPDEEFEEYDKASFWVEEIANDRVNIGISNKNNKNNGTFSKVQSSQGNLNNEYKINMFVDLGSAANKNNSMGISSDDKNINENSFQTGNYNNVDNIKIIIYVGSDTRFNLEKVEINPSTSNISPYIPNNTTLETGTYIYEIKKNGKKTDSFEMLGTMIKQGPNSRVDIYYGESK